MNYRNLGEKMNKKLFTFLTLAILLTLAISANKAFAATPVIFTDPTEVEVEEPGVEFTIKIKIINAENVAMWQISLKFNPEILECLNASIPPDNFFAGKVILAPDPLIDNQTGTIFYGATIFPLVGINGNGTLCQIWFKGKAVGSSALEFILTMPYQTYLENPDGIAITFEKLDGSVTVIPENFALIALLTFTPLTIAIIIRKRNDVHRQNKAK